MCLISPPTEKPLNSHLTALDTVQLWADVEEEIQLCISRVGGTRGSASRRRGGFPLVKVNDILDLLTTTALDDPVVAIKGLGVADETSHAGLGAQGASTEALETGQLGPSALLARTAFPALDQEPRPFVHRVVDGDDGADG